jgi:two-component system phosphate regulon response regulator PhoB
MAYILLIEDDLQQANWAMRLLRSEGFAVMHASSAARGLLLIRQEIPGLILMDLELPDIAGQTAAQLIRKELDDRTPPIVAFSAHDDGAYRQSAKQAGFQAFIAKPSCTEELLCSARYFLQQSTDERHGTGPLAAKSSS